MSQKEVCQSRLGTVGGQAVLEGVMMKSKDRVALSVRDMNGEIRSELVEYKPAAAKHKILKWPLIRGIANFVEMMVLSMKTLNRSADMIGLEEEETKFEKWLREKFGKSLANVASAIGMILGLVLAFALFFYLPAFLSDLFDGLIHSRLLKSCIDGGLKIAIFLSYISLVTLIPDMKRVFQYHGAEHKSIYCYEYGLAMTPENVKMQSRFHPRCGTSFLFVIMIIGILVSTLYIRLPIQIRVIVKLLMLPVIVGLGYEFIRYAGTHQNKFVKILSAPGLWIQRLTTKEPDLSQIEVAIQSLKCALPAEFPEAEQLLASSDSGNDKARGAAEPRDEGNDNP